MNKLTPEQMVERAWDIHQIKNLISAHAYAHAYNRHDWELDELWVREPEHTETMSFAQPFGFTVGQEQLRNDYDHMNTVMSRRYLRDLRREHPEIADSPENYGTGMMMIHHITTPLIEIAEDGMTAQGVFDGCGQYTMPPEGEYLIPFERYHVDLVKENGQWRIWKMFIANDCQFEAGAAEYETRPVFPEDEVPPEPEADPDFILTPNYPMRAYNSIFGIPEWPPFPEPYRSYDETVGYEVFSHPDYKEDRA